MNELKKDYQILKSHKLKGGLISITYRSRSTSDLRAEAQTVKVEDDGGSWKSLYLHINWERCED